MGANILEMKIKRSPKGELLAIAQHEENSYFWKSDLTECPKFSVIKNKLEVTLMVSWWNKLYHEEFEIWCRNLLKNIYRQKS